MSSQNVVADKEKAKLEIGGLVEKYNKILEEKRDSKYNEEMTKKDFILPLFRALGWNVEESSEVTAEEKISKKRVDYGFRIIGIPKFYLEAKSLKENLYDPKFVEQAINYSWLKGCTWAVLTNFSTVIIFNSEWKTENVFQSRFRTILCQEFLDRFDELWLLSKVSFEHNLIDKEAERLGKKIERINIDKQLLSDFTRFRELLSMNITKNNQAKNLTEDELDESTQRILDRLIFIRNCEDRELEPKTLMSNYREWESRGRGQLIKSLRDIFTDYREKYNSEIFGKEQKHLCDDLDIDNEVLHEIIEGLYYTKGLSYDFSAIPADILGNIYEQYLSHILKKTEKRVKLTESQVHRKEQGIYYTPTYIVDFIVRNTLGELLKEKKVNVGKLRVLDPACGSGSFLIRAFDILNEYYRKNEKDYTQTQLDTTGTGVTYSKKLEILRNNIFGVDLDKQAVEIAKLNLLLKIAEKGRRLPLLDQNIKCGNSLIDNEIAGDKAFQWKEQFPEIMKDRFDVIIGNPPWLMAGYYVENQIEYLHNNYQSAMGKFDLYYCFIELGLNLLSKNGIFGMIVPNKFFLTKAGIALRRRIIQSESLFKVIDFGYEKVFGEATNYPCIILLQNKNQSKVIYSKVDAKLNIIEEYKIDLSSLDQNGWYFENQKERNIFKKIEIMGIPLEKLVKRFGTGVQTGADRIFLIDNKKAFLNEESTLKPIFRGRDIRRYSLSKSHKFLIFPYKVVNEEYEIMSDDEIKQYKIIYSLLSSKKDELSKRRWFGKNALELSGKWYGLMYLDSYKSFISPHILTPSLSNISNFTLGTGSFFVTGTAGGTSIILKDSHENIKYLLGLLNSKIISFYIIKHSPVFQGGYHKFSSNYLKKIPIKRINFKDPIEKNMHNKIVELVDKMLSFNVRLNEIGDKLTDERARIENEIKKTDARIDELVYEIYGITEDEKKIIEESLK